jgi:Mrp family chromosome partitioning ATPase
MYKQMSESCSHNCESCGENCSSRTEPGIQKEALNAASSVKRVIGVVSGKGGVGKSLVTAMLSVLFQRRGMQSAVLDADITGPSIPKVFGIKEKAQGSEFGILPARTKTGIDVMSVNLLLPSETDPVVWRGPIIAGTVKQFWTDVVWKDVDYLFVDMPPGTGDVPLTVFQSLPVDGIVIVTSPQELVSMIVAKAVNMAKLMDVPILGIVENMSYFECPDCKKRVSIFGDSHIDEVAANHGTRVLGRLPIDPDLARLCDNGLIELFEGDYLDAAADEIERALEN